MTVFPQLPRWIYLLSMLCSLLAFRAQAQYGEWQWFTTGKGLFYQYIESFTSDSEGNVYWSCTSSRDVVFGQDTVVVNDTLKNGFVLKLDSAGQVRWIKRFIGHDVGFVNAQRVLTDSKSMVYLFISASVPFRLDAHQFSGTGAYFSVLAKLNPEDGSIVWARTFNDVNVERKRVGISANDDIYLSGGIFETMEWDGIVLTKDSLARRNMFVAQLDEEGHVNWAKQAKGPGDQYTTELLIDDDQNVILFATKDSVFAIDDSIYSHSGYGKLAIKYSSQGELEWVRNVDNPYSAGVSGRALDGDGNLYLFGTFAGDSVRFGEMSASKVSEYRDLYLAKLNPEGEAIELVSFGGDFDDSAWDLHVDPDGTVYLSGTSRLDWWYTGQLDFFACYNPDFTLRYDLKTTMRYFTRDHEGDFLVTGDFSGAKEINDSIYTGDKWGDIYLAKLSHLTDPPRLAVDIQTTPINGIDEIPGSAQFFPSGGIPPYKFLYGLPYGGDYIEHSTPGQGKVTIIDQFGAYLDTTYGFGFDSLPFDVVNDRYETSDLDAFEITANGHENIAGYTWNEVPGEQSFFVPEFGTYVVSAEFNSGYRVVDTCEVVLLTSLENLMDGENEPKFYPIPAREELVIEHTKGIFEISVMNLQGQQIALFHPDHTAFRLPMDHLNTGHYLIKITDDQGRVSFHSIAKK